MMTISLRPITIDNWVTCAELKPTEEQERAMFVSPNTFSLAQAHFEPWWEPLGIYVGDLMVGFVMHGRWPTSGLPDYYPPDLPKGMDCILRFMIEKSHQRKGYGRAAMIQVIERIRQRPGAHTIELSYDPHNLAAAALYASVGFKPTGRVFYEEIVAELDLQTA
jgi:diamine N-acetyltransferase